MTKGKKLTDKEKEERTIFKIVKKLRNLEKTYPKRLIERACFRYKDANLQKRSALKEINFYEKKLAQAQKILDK